MLDVVTPLKLLPPLGMGGDAELDVITLLLSNGPPAPLLLLPAGDGINGKYPGGMIAG